MLETKIIFKVIIPGAVFFELETKVILFHGKDGDFAILPGHENLISLTLAGTVKTGHDVDKLKSTLITSPGIVKVSENVCTLFADRAILIEDIKHNLTTLKDDLTSSEKILSKYKKENLANPFLEDKIKFLEKATSDVVMY